MLKSFFFFSIVTKSNWKITSDKMIMLLINWITIYGLKRLADSKNQLKNLTYYLIKMMESILTFWQGREIELIWLRVSFHFYSLSSMKTQTFCKTPDGANRMKSTAKAANHWKKSNTRRIRVPWKYHQNNRADGFASMAFCRTKIFMNLIADITFEFELSLTLFCTNDKHDLHQIFCEWTNKSKQKALTLMFD